MGETIKPHGHVTVNVKQGRSRPAETVVDQDVPVEGAPGSDCGEELARIRFAHGETVSPRQFFSTRVDVELALPCPVDFGAIDAAYDFVRGWVDERLGAALDEYAGDGGER